MRSRQPAPHLPAMVLAAVLAIAAVGCEERTVPPLIDPQLELLVAGRAQRDLDILVVVDNDATMGRWQSELGEHFAAMVAGLGQADSGLPNAHIGVVTTDLGAGPYEFPGCTPGGDGGDLRPLGASCAEAPCNFIMDVEDEDCQDPNPANCRYRNFTGSIEEAFASIALPGTAGCRFEQPLEAMRLALSGNPNNAGFRRENAALSVIFVTDGDDCSAHDTTIFDPDEVWPDSPIGPFGRFRCFEYGVQCDPDEPRAPGVKSDCRARGDSPYFNDVGPYATFLQGLGGRDQPVFVTVLAGDATPVEVAPAPMDGAPSLLFSCVADEGTPEEARAGPAVRLTEFAGYFEEDFRFVTSLCTTTTQDVLDNMVAQINGLLAGTCLTGDLFDNDPVLDGVQPACDVIESDPASEMPRDIVDCATNPARPCFEIVENLRRCPTTDSQLSLEIRRDQPPPPGSVVAMACDVKTVTEGYEKSSYYGCSVAPATSHGPAGRTGLGLLALVALCLARRRRCKRRGSARTRADVRRTPSRSCASDIDVHRR